MKLQEENKILKSVIHVAEGQLCQIQNVLNDLEQYSRRECLEIQGIPASEDSVNESTNDIVCKISKLMGVEIASEDVSVSHRLPINKIYKGKRSTQAIIVKFVRKDVNDVETWLSQFSGPYKRGAPTSPRPLQLTSTRPLQREAPEITRAQLAVMSRFP